MSPSSTLDALRATIESIERHAPEGGLRPSAHAQRRRAVDGEAAAGWGKALSFGLPELDARFASGGLPYGAHELAGPPGEPASALLFAALMLTRRFQADAGAQALVVQEPSALAEGGGLYAPGLWALGLDPARLVLVCAGEGGEALRITDEAVRSGAVAAVLTEAPRAARKLDLAATQRLNLYGRQTSTLALLITPDLAATSAAMTRWRVRTAQSQAPKAYLGPPALELELVKNRLGPTGRLTVEWSSDHGAFRRPDYAAAAALRSPVVPTPAHRPAGSGRGRGSGDGGDAQERAQAYGVR
jgi:protein ImuA